MKWKLLAAVVVWVPSGGACAAPPAHRIEAPREIAFFDAHIHLTPRLDGDELVEMAAEHGMTGMAFLGTVDTTPLADRYPGFCVPCAHATDFDGDTADELAAQLEDGARCIGELSVKHFPARGMPQGANYAVNDPDLMAVYALVGSVGVAVNVHIDYDEETIWEFDDALELNPATDFIWAHLGDATASQVRSLIEVHPNLNADLSSRNDLFRRDVRPAYSIDQQSLLDEHHVLDPEWRDLFQDYPDRFLVGTDIGPPGREDLIAEIADYYRDVLMQLDARTRPAIARRNAERLFLE